MVSARRLAYEGGQEDPTGGWFKLEQGFGNTEYRSSPDPNDKGLRGTQRGHNSIRGVFATQKWRMPGNYLLSGQLDLDWRNYWLSQTYSLKAFEMGESSVELAAQMSFVSQQTTQDR
jgi:hypothetical protein